MTPIEWANCFVAALILAYLIIQANKLMRWCVYAKKKIDRLEAK